MFALYSNFQPSPIYGLTISKNFHNIKQKIKMQKETVLRLHFWIRLIAIKSSQNVNEYVVELWKKSCQSNCIDLPFTVWNLNWAISRLIWVWNFTLRTLHTGFFYCKFTLNLLVYFFFFFFFKKLRLAPYETGNESW